MPVQRRKLSPPFPCSGAADCFYKLGKPSASQNQSSAAAAMIKQWWQDSSKIKNPWTVTERATKDLAHFASSRRLYIPRLVCS